MTENPLPWLQSLLSGVEHANFFEARATEYSKAATTGRLARASRACGAKFDRMMERRGRGGGGALRGREREAAETGVPA